MSGSRSLGNMVVRLAVELAQYKANWSEAVTTTQDGAAKIEQSTAQAATGVDKLTNAASKLPGELGNTAGKAGQLIGVMQTATGVSAALAAGLAAVAAGAGVVAYAAMEGAKEQRKLNDSLLLTGNYAGLVSGQLDRMALSVANSIGGKVSASREVLAGLVSTGKFTVQSLGEVASAVQLVARYSGQTNEAVLKDFAGMADGVTKWANKHNEAYHYLDSATLRYIKVLEDQGNQQEAMRVSSEALSKHLGGDLQQNLNWLGRTLDSVSGKWSKYWAAASNLGKVDGPQEKLAASSEYLQKATPTYRPEDPRLQLLKAENLERQKRAEWEQRDAANQSAQAQAAEKSNKADEGWLKLSEQKRNSQQRMNAELETARRLAAESNKSAKELADMEEAIRASYAKKPPKPRKEVDPYDALLKSARERLAVLELEAVATDKVTEAEKLRAKYEADLVAGTIKFNAVKDQAYRLTLDQMQADEKAAVMKDRVAKATTEAAKAHEAHIKALVDGIDKQQTELDKQLEHNAALGLSKTAVAELTAARLEDVAASLEVIAIRKWEKNLEDGLYELRKKEVALMRERASAIRAGAAKEETLDQLQKGAKESERLLESLDRTAHDVFVSMADKGANMAQKLGQVIKASLLDLLYQMTARKWFINVGASVTGGGAAGLANAAQGGGGGGGIAGMNWLSDFGGSVRNTSFDLGGRLWNAGFENVGQTLIEGSEAIGKFAGMAGDAFGYISALSAAGEGKWGQAIGSAVGTYFGGPIGSFIGSTIGKFVDNAFGGKGGPKAEGGYAPGGMDIAGLDAGGKMQGSQRGDVTAAQNISKTISTAFANVAAALNLNKKSVDVGVFYAKDPEGDSPTQVQVASSAYNRSTRLGGIENVGRDDEAAKAEFAAEASRVIISEALADSGLDQKIKDYFAKIDLGGDAATLSAAIDSAVAAKQLQDVLGQFGPVFSDLANLSVEAKVKLAEAGGGLQALVGGLNAYYAAFYSAEEQRLQVAKNITASVNAAGGDVTVENVLGATREQFRAVVENAAKDTSEAGIKLWTALMNVAGAFAAITPAAEKVTAAVVDQAAADRQATDAAMTAMQRAISARRDVAAAAAADSQDLVARLQSIFDLLGGHVRDLYGEVESTNQLAAAQGEAFIAIALAKARAGGGLPEEKGLSEAIDAARGGLASRTYTKGADRDFDRLVLAGQLKALADAAGPQLTAAERQAQTDQQALDYLDALANDAKAQLDELRGLGGKASDLNEMVALFWQAFNKEKGVAGAGATGAMAGSAGGGAGGFVTGGGSSNAATAGASAPMSAFDSNASGLVGYLGIGALVGSLDWSAASYEASFRAVHAQAMRNHWTSAQVAEQAGVSAADILAQATQYNLPAFARGGDHAGGWMKAGEQGEELIYSPPARIFNATDTEKILGRDGNGSSAEMVAELRAMRGDFAAMQRELGLIKDVSKESARYLKGSTRGGSPVMLTEAG